MLVRSGKVVISSIVASTVDLVTLLTLVGLAGLAAGAAAMLACLAGGAVNFTLCRRWIFSARASWRQIPRYFLFVVLGGAVLVGGLVHLAVQHLGAPVLIARLAVSLVVLFAWNYPVSKHVVFREARSS